MPICIRCETEQASPSPGCSYHPGDHVFAYCAGAREDYNDVFVWSCCGRRVLGTNDGTFDVHPARVSGCVSGLDHKVHGRIAVVADQRILDGVKLVGIDVAPILIDDFLQNADFPPDSECVVLALNTFDNIEDDRFILAFEELRKRARDTPVIIFTLPRRADGWPVHAVEADENRFSTYLKSAVWQTLRRHGTTAHYRPEVFISYARRDYAIVHSNIFAFRGTYWLDKVFLTPGVAWASEIDAAIDTAQIFALFVSATLQANS
jgi:hypothetical protein